MPTRNVTDAVGPVTSARQRFHSSCAALIAFGKAMISDGKTSMKRPLLLGPAPPWGDMPLWSIRRKEDSLHGIAFCISCWNPLPPPEQAEQAVRPSVLLLLDGLGARRSGPALNLVPWP